METKQMKRAFSAGGIVFNKKNEVLLIKAGSLRDTSVFHWGFPKGTLEEGESSKSAAVREVEEETGVKAEIIAKVGDSKYMYTYKEFKIFKIVVIFLMEYISGELNPQAGEIEEVRWVKEDQVLEMLSFSADKALFKKAIEVKGASS